MGKTSFSGPVFGAKQTLFSVGPVAASTGSSAVFAGTVIPPGEDWYATELLLYRNSTGSTNFVVSLHDDSTLLGSVTAGGSSVAMSNYAIIAKDANEYEGKQMLSGSTITLSHSSHAGPNINLVAVLRGYTRFANSTRPE